MDDFFLQERNNKPSAPVNTHGSMDEVMRQGHPVTNDAKKLMKDSSHSSESRASEEAGQSEAAEDDGNVLTKLRKMVSKPLGHMPSLAVDNPFSEDGVLQRPCENGVEDGRDDTDSISAYEDASAETPEQDRMFPGEAGPSELPDDSERSSTHNDGESQDPKNPEGCVMS